MAATTFTIRAPWGSYPASHDNISRLYAMKLIVPHKPVFGTHVEYSPAPSVPLEDVRKAMEALGIGVRQPVLVSNVPKDAASETNVSKLIAQGLTIIKEREDALAEKERQARQDAQEIFANCHAAANAALSAGGELTVYPDTMPTLWRPGNSHEFHIKPFGTGKVFATIYGHPAGKGNRHGSPEYWEFTHVGSDDGMYVVEYNLIENPNEIGAEDTRRVSTLAEAIAAAYLAHNKFMERKYNVTDGIPGIYVDSEGKLWQKNE